MAFNGVLSYWKGYFESKKNPKHFNIVGLLMGSELASIAEI
jgi:hypothetical protein